MNLSRSILLLQFAAALALGQSSPPSLPDQPEAFARSFYKWVVARHPVGLPGVADMKILAPYLSTALLHRIDLARACSHDWDRQHPGITIKPQVAWLESGLFSGQDERTGPNAFEIERTEKEKDGSSQVYVRLKWWETSDSSADKWHTTPERPAIWQVGAIVTRENGHLVLDDVIFLKDKFDPVDRRLSEVLAKGCDGPRWVGYRDE